MKSLNCCLLKLRPAGHLDFSLGSAVRGFIASFFDDEMLANRKDKKLRYATALVQYKVIEGEVVMIGLSEGAEYLYWMRDRLPFLRLHGEKIAIRDRSCFYGEQCFGLAGEPISYRFLTPWVALNQENFARYRGLEVPAQHDLLRRILVGNIISFSKNFGYDVTDRIVVEELALVPGSSYVKKKTMASFRGEFRVNFLLPQYWGIGRSPSRGFGTVVQL